MEKQEEKKQKSQKSAEQEVIQEKQENQEMKDTEELDVKEIDEKEQKIKELEDKYLRLYSEFENFRRRTAKERLELSTVATEDLMKELLPVLDDFERGMKAMETAEEVAAVKQGVELIFDKFYKTLKSKGLEPIDAIGKELDTELHEAITQAPAPEEKLKGKIMDVVEKGYLLNGKVIRFAKAVIGN